ncbi:alpha/beta fold hydrolase [Halobacillus sp. KGW1]|uniref:alpha/beta hydrolase n=1 Tax=Halobacillus sp. KGW1 TaxID=1793726 RepID=UPI00078248AA|nr:alpha/beta hydrolase [Halobacillus sp. KGW1]
MTKATWSHYRARDFSSLPYIAFQRSPGNKEAIIMIHGITAELDHHKKFASFCKRKADVFLPLLRGYDQKGKRGDIDYLGQYDDDLSDFIHFIRKQGYGRIVLAGHSMGCANILRLMDLHPDIAEEYLFIAPFFHPTLPVYHDDATEQGKPETDVDYVIHDKKMIALVALHKMNIHRFDDAHVAEIPDEFHYSNRLKLSFRLLLSRFPENIVNDLFSGMEDRVSIFIGDEDEVIVHPLLKNWVKETWGLDVLLIPGVDHNHILHHSDLHRVIAGRHAEEL